METPRYLYRVEVWDGPNRLDPDKRPLPTLVALRILSEGPKTYLVGTLLQHRVDKDRLFSHFQWYRTPEEAWAACVKELTAAVEKGQDAARRLEYVEHVERAATGAAT